MFLHVSRAELVSSYVATYWEQLSIYGHVLACFRDFAYIFMCLFFKTRLRVYFMHWGQDMFLHVQALIKSWACICMCQRFSEALRVSACVCM
jgi:hypothetical protein